MRRTANRLRRLLSVAALLASPATAAGPFVVTSTADLHDAAPGDGVCSAGAEGCTLRAAIEEASAATGESTLVELPTPGARYPLNQRGGVLGELVVDGGIELEIRGPERGPLPIVDGDAIRRVLHALPGTRLTVDRVEIRHGYAGSDAGGGILADTLILRRSAVTSSGAYAGGGVACAICRISDSWLGGNGAYYGGGLRAGEDTVIERSSFTWNQAHSGGAIIVSAYDARFTMIDSTIAENRVLSQGVASAILLTAGQADLRNVTIARNAGGATSSSTLRGGTFTLRNTLVAGNGLLTGGPECVGDETTVVELAGYNLLDRSLADCPVTFASASAGEQLGVDPLLTDLGLHGGPTPTVAFEESGPATDAGDPAGCRDADEGVLLVDQRGTARAIARHGSSEPRCDVGALEHDLLLLDGFESGDFARWSEVVF